jgi:preprotein translocase subunit SecD
MRRKKSKKLLFFIALLVGLVIYLDLPKDFPIRINLGRLKINQTISSPEINFKLGSAEFKRDLTIKKGLDLQGGTHLVLEADMEKIAQENQEQALNSARNVISRRVDMWGVSESLIQTAKTEDNYRIIVELPGIKNVNQAIDLIGRTAQLDFRKPPEQEQDQQASPSAVSIMNYQPTGLTGKDLQKAAVQFNNQTGEPVVGLIFNNEGAKKFAEITKNNVGKRIAVFLDEAPLTAPVVNEPITDGNAMISGRFNVTQAKELAIQLNAGALPVPLEVVEQRTIGATLGEQAVQQSVYAGLFGLAVVALFMVALYGFPGLLADIGLIIYGLITLALYKLIPITLTLPGIAGFILSVGMAVDSNILIFERMKEELRMGKPFNAAMELGFGRAWDSIKDANVCTLITCFVLLNPFNWGFLNTSGVVRGFAITLGLGIFVSMFTGIVATRTLLRVFYKEEQ